MATNPMQYGLDPRLANFIDPMNSAYFGTAGNGEQTQSLGDGRGNVVHWGQLAGLGYDTSSFYGSNGDNESPTMGVTNPDAAQQWLQSQGLQIANQQLGDGRFANYLVNAQGQVVGEPFIGTQNDPNFWGAAQLAGAAVTAGVASGYLGGGAAAGAAGSGGIPLTAAEAGYGSFPAGMEGWGGLQVSSAGAGSAGTAGTVGGGLSVGGGAGAGLYAPAGYAAGGTAAGAGAAGAAGGLFGGASAAAPWLAGANALTGIIGAATQGNAAQNASAAQQAAAQAGITQQNNSLQTLQTQLAPYTAAGPKALAGQMDLAGLNGPQAQAAAIAALRESPQFTAQQQMGEERILANASATGGLRGGNVQAALGQFSPALLASTINDQYSRLGGLTQIGQNSAAGVGTATINTGNNIANLLQQQGAAQAGGALSQGQQQSGYWGAISNAIGMYVGLKGGF